MTQAQVMLLYLSTRLKVASDLRLDFGGLDDDAAPRQITSSLGFTVEQHHRKKADSRLILQSLPFRLLMKACRRVLKLVAVVCLYEAVVLQWKSILSWPKFKNE